MTKQHPSIKKITFTPEKPAMTTTTPAKSVAAHTYKRAAGDLTIELRAIKQYESMSEETNCYEATLYANDKLVCRVSNRGFGGPDDATDWKAYNALNDMVKATFPKWQLSEEHPELMNTDLELLCGQMVVEFCALRDMRKRLRTHLLYTVNDGPSIYEIKKPKVDASRLEVVVAKWCAQLQQRPTTKQVLNSLPEAEALQLYNTAE